MTRVSFKPLTRGRYRLLVDGAPRAVVVKKARVKATRSMLVASGGRHSAFNAVSAPTIRPHAVIENGYAECPHCKLNTRRFHAGKNKCRNCGVVYLT